MIRVLAPEDLEAYRALWHFGLGDDPSAFLLTVAEAVATPQSALVAKLGNGEVFGAFEGAQLVGFAAFRRGGPERMRHMADVGPIYVHPSARRLGLARALLGAVIQAAQDAGVLQLELCVDVQNEGALRLYEACGFSQIGLRPRSVIVDGQARDDRLMLKQLDA